ncbi:hypothetical protein AUR64_03285 [Haloprofundus marisrubri]|uniref:Uncharacterized protein n=1 Tax=Haloprofundus marisrubri TaxID=1514971 RepID=A0A0W1RDP0_9EURY|nr:hypothetical protein [Haloprofundus marisrubri]KTG11537.1 hypothetical protein AUR64_03285 [Haloprofundus marisrubri]
MKPQFRRREALSLLAGMSLTGCAGRVPGIGPEEVEASRLQPIVEQTVPTVPQTVPVSIEASFVAGHVEEARQLRNEVPAPLDSDEIPNEAIRERMNRLAEVVDERLRAVSDGATPFERLQRAQRARVGARELSAAWRTIDTEFTTDGVRDDARSVREAVDAFVSRWSYLGDDPVRALRVHGEIERSLQAARNWATFESRDYPSNDTGPFVAGEMASDLERARTHLTLASYLFERLRNDIDSERNLRSRFEETKQGLIGRVKRRRGSLPDRSDDESPTALVDRTVDETAGVWGLHSLYEETTREARALERTQSEENESVANVSLDVLDLFGALLSIRGFEQLRRRIENGDDVDVSSASDLRSVRQNAVNAIEAARETTQNEALVRYFLPRYVSYIRWGDKHFEGRSGTIPVSGLRRDASEYVVATSLYRALPKVSATVAAALRES